MYELSSTITELISQVLTYISSICSCNQGCQMNHNFISLLERPPVAQSFKPSIEGFSYFISSVNGFLRYFVYGFELNRQGIDLH